MSDLLDNELLAELKEIMEDDFGELLETFLTESAKQMNAVSTSLLAGESDQLRRAAHSLKGSCGNIGASQLQAHCAELEASAATGDLSLSTSLVAEAERQLKLVQSEVAALR